jgi:hypothetical protein
MHIRFAFKQVAILMFVMLASTTMLQRVGNSFDFFSYIWGENYEVKLTWVSHGRASTRKAIQLSA